MVTCSKTDDGAFGLIALIAQVDSLLPLRIDCISLFFFFHSFFLYFFVCLIFWGLDCGVAEEYLKKRLSKNLKTHTNLAIIIIITIILINIIKNVLLLLLDDWVHI